MDQIISFVEAHTADICLLLLGVLTSICNDPLSLILNNTTIQI